MSTTTGPEHAGKGIGEDLKGKAKEVAGRFMGDEDLRQEGRAQQDKAEAEREAAAHEAKAEKAEAKSSLAETRQRAHQ